MTSVVPPVGPPKGPLLLTQFYKQKFLYKNSILLCDLSFLSLKSTLLENPSIPISTNFSVDPPTQQASSHIPRQHTYTRPESPHTLDTCPDHTPFHPPVVRVIPFEPTSLQDGSLPSLLQNLLLTLLLSLRIPPTTRYLQSLAIARPTLHTQSSMPVTPHCPTTASLARPPGTRLLGCPVACQTPDPNLHRSKPIVQDPPDPQRSSSISLLPTLLSVEYFLQMPFEHHDRASSPTTSALVLQVPPLLPIP